MKIDLIILDCPLDAIAKNIIGHLALLIHQYHTAFRKWCV